MGKVMWYKIVCRLVHKYQCIVADTLLWLNVRQPIDCSVYSSFNYVPLPTQVMYILHIV